MNAIYLVHCTRVSLPSSQPNYRNLNVVLYHPQIPQNTGNIVRTCAAVGATLHLIKPLGFSITEKSIKRAGLDYWSKAKIVTHNSLDHILQNANQLLLLSTHGKRCYTEICYHQGTYLLFGNETQGLPEDLKESYSKLVVRIPMRPGLRSLNLSNSVAIVVYEALRQLDFPGIT